MNIPPEIISGEALICSWWAWVAIAHVYQRNQSWAGWSDDAPFAVLWVAALSPMLPDTSRGAQFVFSRADLGKRQVLKIIGGMKLKARFG